MHPGCDGGFAGESWQSLPNASERFLRQIGCVGVIPGKPPQKGIDFCIVKFDELDGRAPLTGAHPFYKLDCVRLHLHSPP
jgi:hypothetical protein